MSKASKIIAGLSAAGAGLAVAAGVLLAPPGEPPTVVKRYGRPDAGPSPSDISVALLHEDAAACVHLLKRGGDNASDYPNDDSSQTGRLLMAQVQEGGIIGWHTTAEMVDLVDAGPPIQTPMGPRPAPTQAPTGECDVSVWLDSEQAEGWQGLLTAPGPDGGPSLADVVEAPSPARRPARFAGMPEHEVGSFNLEAAP